MILEDFFVVSFLFHCSDIIIVNGKEKERRWKSDFCGLCEKLKRQLGPFDDIILEFLQHLVAY